MYKYRERQMEGVKEMIYELVISSLPKAYREEARHYFYLQKNQRSHVIPLTVDYFLGGLIYRLHKFSRKIKTPK